MVEEKSYTVEEIATKLNVNIKTVEKYIREKKLKADINPVSNAVVGIRESQYNEFIGIASLPEEKPQGAEIPSKVVGSVPTEVEEAQKQTRLAKEAADQAEQLNKQTKSRIDRELYEKGYASLKEGLADIQKKADEAKAVLEDAGKIKLATITEAENLVKEQERLKNVEKVLKLREEKTNARWQEIVEYENKQKEFVKQYNGWESMLQGMIVYHKENIQPCVDTLRIINKTLNKWMEMLEKAKIDFTPLSNFIFKKAEVLEKYIEVEDKPLPDFSKESPSEEQKVAKEVVATEESEEE